MSCRTAICFWVLHFKRGKLLKIVMPMGSVLEQLLKLENPFEP